MSFLTSNLPVSSWWQSKPKEMEVPLPAYFKDYRNKLALQTLCKIPIVSSCSAYSGLLGLLGTGLSLFDILRVISYGSALPCSLWRSRIEPGKIVSLTCERDLKLISLVLSLQSYFLLLVGALTDNALFFLPWLFMYAVIILAEFIIFVCRLLSEGFKISKHGLTLTLFITYNWLTVFCSFYRIVKPS